MLHINRSFARKGSFMLGTMIKPICADDDLDIDLVCELTGKIHSGHNIISNKWSEIDLKQTRLTKICLIEKDEDVGH